MEYRNLEIGALVLFIILLYFSYKTILPIFDAMVIAVVLAYMVRPIAQHVSKWVRYRSLAVFISMFVLVVPLLLIGLYVVNDIVSTFKSSDLAMIVRNSFTNFDAIIDSVTRSVFGFFNVELESLQQQTIDAISSEITKLSERFYNYVFSLAGSIPLILFKIILAAVFAFYFIRDGSNLKEHLVGIVPADHKERFDQLLRGTDIMFQAVVIGYLLKAIFTGIIAIVIFYLFDLPHPLLLGITTGILDFIPVIGPWIVELLLFIWFIYQGQYAFAFALLLATYFFVSFIPEMYIRPRLSGDAAGLHPLIILVGVIGGLFAFGAIGIIIGPMFLGLVVVIVRVYLYKQPYEKIHFGYKDTFLNVFRIRGARETDKKQGP